MIYVDSSVPLLALMEQTGGSEAAALDEHRGEALRKVSSALLDVEVSRALRREGLDPALADALLDSIDLVVIDDEVVQRAKALTGELKSLDAIHLATALMLDHPRDPVVLLTHAARLAEAARTHGLEVIDPAA
jgi:hypothetical protein avisC_07029